MAVLVWLFRPISVCCGDVFCGLLWTVFVSLSLSWQANEAAVMFHRIVSVQWAKPGDGSKSKYTVYPSLRFHSFSYDFILPFQPVLVVLSVVHFPTLCAF